MELIGQPVIAFFFDQVSKGDVKDILYPVARLTTRIRKIIFLTNENKTLKNHFTRDI